MADLLWNITHNQGQVTEFRTAGMVPPNAVLFGCGAVERLGTEAARLASGKAEKVFFVSDNNLVRIGVADRVFNLLAAEKLKVEAFTGVEPEPHIEVAEEMYDQCTRSQSSLVIGIGGGSVMDLAKLTAQAVARGVSPRDFFESGVKADSRGLPLILAPTTAGTGSEVSPNLVMAIGEAKRFLNSPYYYPDLALIDPMLTVSMPARVTASTGIDALSHGIEAMLHVQANPLSDALAVAGIEMVGSYLRRAFCNGQDIEARYYMAFASTLCMMGMAMCGGLYAHSASYVIAKFKPTSHGVGCALGLPYTMAYNLPVSTHRLARISAALGEPTWRLSTAEAAERAIYSVVGLMRDIGLPVSLREYGIKESDLAEMAELMIKLYYRPMNPRPMALEDSVVFWRKMWEGTI